MPHVKRDTAVKAEQTSCEDDGSLMQAWSEDGAALVRRRCGEGVSYPEMRLPVELLTSRGHRVKHKSLFL
ncbi:hypothetical protein [Anaerorudis cellulosivorans]|uniref:hypothetical protein n=1 Tax=Anaerorudis cellulosivorans TaxID=3397862 RepID=UPI00222061E9|nr:hypothetical protein [Seramator thermalis]MCW1735733.1 hypothetical protein [Seramator thermalis]